MTTFPHLPLFTDAFIADTMHLSAEQTGAYLMLLMCAWRSGGRLPDDDRRLTKWSRVAPKRWHLVKPAVMEFWTLADGWWTQKRLSKEYERTTELAARNRMNGAAGGRPKLLKTNEAENPDGLPNETQTKAPIPIPIDIPSETNVSSGSAREARSKKPRTQIDPTWQIEAKHVATAEQHGLNEGTARAEWVRFVANHAAKGSLMASWDQAWLTWVTSPYPKARPNNRDHHEMSAEERIREERNPALRIVMEMELEKRMAADGQRPRDDRQNDLYLPDLRCVG